MRGRDLATCHVDVRQVCAFLAGVVFSLSISAGLCSARPAARTRIAATPKTPRLIFQEIYREGDEALKNKDIDANLANYDPDFVEIEPSGQQTDMGDIRYRLSTDLDLAKSVVSSTSVISANIQGINGTAMVHSEVDMVLVNPDTNAKVLFVDKIVSKDTWLKQPDDTWSLQRSKIYSEVTTSNGKKVLDKSKPFDTAKPKTDDDNSDDTTDGGAMN